MAFSDLLSRYAALDNAGEALERILDSLPADDAAAARLGAMVALGWHWEDTEGLGQVYWYLFVEDGNGKPLGVSTDERVRWLMGAVAERAAWGFWCL